MLLFIIGPTVACARAGVDDLSSFERMEENGWDLKAINEETRLVLPKETCEKNLVYINNFNWIVQRWLVSRISTMFWGHGRVALSFGNCNNEGEVSVLLDGEEIKKSRSDVEETTATFNVKEGSNLTISTDNRAIIKLFDFKLKCGTFRKIIYNKILSSREDNFAFVV